MLKLLIVDNERIIVESLLDLFERNERIELEVHGAYSSLEALELLRRTRIDIVLSDIRMPGMDGLELQREIVKEWPWCKVIFLTGYDDFEYIHQAVRNGGIDYLLKMEGNEAIVRAVEKAAAELYEAVASRQLLEHAKRQLQLARPLLLQEYVMELVQGDADAHRRRAVRFAELSLPLGSADQVLLAIGRVDDWGDSLSNSDRQLLLYAIANIADEYFAKASRCVSVSFERNKLLWLIQPAGDGAADSELSTKASHSQLIRFIHGTIETVQYACKQYLKLSLSFAAADRMRAWEDAPEQFHALKRLFGRGLGLGKEFILLDKSSQGGQVQEPPIQTQAMRSQLEKLGAMSAYLENGQRQHFETEYAKLMDMAASLDRPDTYLRLEIYASLVAIFLSYMNRWGLHAEIGQTFDLGRLASLDADRHWHEVEAYFSSLADRLFEQKQLDQHSSEGHLIRHVQLYVEHNLAGDLSLTRIGEVVGYNPYYLTRLYKQRTNEGLTEYIIRCRLAKAQRLLTEGQMIVQDISRAVGFMTEQSFYRFFKKAAGCTPQEYRERSMLSKTDNEK
ncbi:DNA-binding response regulator [Paenibacillus sp. 598K]|uniref:response regulator n=1 Tax=Paenibacillus sp. 598K TaxID=1117987 RepID=UPI000FF95E01|nr:response regulator [Paenibacillus sp. 598K]GBF74696.1 DNA-binding response regulator [Paenibacillus sp. 598K]